MSRADSILQTASIARWVSAAVTATDHTIVILSAQGGATGSLCDRGPPRPAVPNMIILLGSYPFRGLAPFCISERPAAAFLTSSGKSDSSCTWRTSITSLSEPGHREAHSIASAIDFTWIIQ